MERSGQRRDEPEKRAAQVKKDEPFLPHILTEKPSSRRPWGGQAVLANGDIPENMIVWLSDPAGAKSYPITTYTNRISDLISWYGYYTRKHSETFLSIST